MFACCWLADGDDDADEFIDDVVQLTNVFDDVEEFDEPVFIWVFELDVVELELDELDEPEAWLVAVACNAAKIAADDRFWVLLCGGWIWLK